MGNIEIEIGETSIGAEIDEGYGTRTISVTI